MKKKSNPTWQEITEGRAPLSKRTRKALETTRAIREKSAELRTTVGMIPMDRDEVLKVTPSDIEQAELQLELAKIEACPRPDRIAFLDGIVRTLKAESHLAGNGSSVAAKGKQSQLTEPRLSDRARAERALSDPAKYPTMTPKEVMAALHLNKSAVYEHSELVRASTGTRTVRFTTASVKAIRESSPE